MGISTRQAYEEGLRDYIDDAVAFQEEVGLDVLVHGEPERTDMVEYFGEMLNGFLVTNNGWVQSYGSRCVKPPIIFGDVSRTETHDGGVGCVRPVTHPAPGKGHAHWPHHHPAVVFRHATTSPTR